MRQTRRRPQSIMEIYGQGLQRSMAQFWPQDFKDFYLKVVLLLHWRPKKTSIIQCYKRLFRTPFSTTERKRALASFQKQTLFGICSCYLINWISNSMTSSMGVPHATSLSRKDSIAVVRSRHSPAQSTRTRSLFFRPNMTTPQQ